MRWLALCSSHLVVEFLVRRGGYLTLLEFNRSLTLQKESIQVSNAGTCSRNCHERVALSAYESVGKIPGFDDGDWHGWEAPPEPRGYVPKCGAWMSRSTLWGCPLTVCRIRSNSPIRRGIGHQPFPERLRARRSSLPSGRMGTGRNPFRMVGNVLAQFPGVTDSSPRRDSRSRARVS